MHPKDSIQSLNLRRELQRRLEFVKRRVSHSPAEFRFATGKSTTLPREQKMPPGWAIEAARSYWTHGIGKAFAHINADSIRGDPSGTTRELIGIYESMLAYVSHPGLSESCDPPEVKAATESLRKMTSRSVTKSLLKHLRALDSRIEELLPPPTVADLAVRGVRYLNGVGALNMSGEFRETETLTVQTYHAIWFGWPMLKNRTNFRALDLKEWVSGQFGIYASDKLIEKVYKDLGFARYKLSSL